MLIASYSSRCMFSSFPLVQNGAPATETGINMYSSQFQTVQSSLGKEKKKLQSERSSSSGLCMYIFDTFNFLIYYDICCSFYSVISFSWASVVFVCWRPSTSFLSPANKLLIPFLYVLFTIHISRTSPIHPYLSL